MFGDLHIHMILDGVYYRAPLHRRAEGASALTASSARAAV